MQVEVCIPGLVCVGMRLDGTGGDFPNSETVTRLVISGLVARENSEKIWEKFGKNLGRYGTTQNHSGNS